MWHELGNLFWLVTLITGIKRNMQNYLMPIWDKTFLRKRFIIETIFGYIKEHFNLCDSH
jgi:hypothetical protein